MTTQDQTNNIRIMLKNVRASFPHLFEKDNFNKYSCSFLIDRETQAKLVEQVESTIDDLTTNVCKSQKALADNKLPTKDGDDTGRDSEAGQLVLSAKVHSGRPVVMLADKTHVTDPEENPIYAGCYVNALVELWGQNHKEYGKRINCTLIAVQFAKHGERFGKGNESADKIAEGFDDVTGDDDDFLAA